ncbi:hypothetical protein BW39_00537 [Delftia sp. RIT313]|nr:hypothetical protein BW39_00537 [Delftia sp. RIT313]
MALAPFRRRAGVASMSRMAWPADTVATPSRVSPWKNETVPCGLLPLTLAVSVRRPGTVMEEGVPCRDVSERCCIWTLSAPVLARASPESETWLALMACKPEGRLFRVISATPFTTFTVPKTVEPLLKTTEPLPRPAPEATMRTGSPSSALAGMACSANWPELPVPILAMPVPRATSREPSPRLSMGMGVASWVTATIRDAPS